jgi:hypothetical protein
MKLISNTLAIMEGEFMMALMPLDLRLRGTGILYIIFLNRCIAVKTKDAIKKSGAKEVVRRLLVKRKD